MPSSTAFGWESKRTGCSHPLVSNLRSDWQEFTSIFRISTKSAMQSMQMHLVIQAMRMEDFTTACYPKVSRPRSRYHWATALIGQYLIILLAGSDGRWAVRAHVSIRFPGNGSPRQSKMPKFGSGSYELSLLHAIRPANHRRASPTGHESINTTADCSTSI